VKGTVLPFTGISKDRKKRKCPQMTRRWFQVNLATLIVLILVSAVFVGLNATQHKFALIDLNPAGRGWSIQADYYGWPCVFIRDYFGDGWEIYSKYASINAFIFLVIIFFASRISETIQRRW